MAQQQTTREIETEKFITHRSWGENIQAFRDHMGRSRQSADRVRTWGTYLWVFQAKAGLVNSKQKSKSYVESHLRRIEAGDPGRQRRLLMTKSIAEVISRT